MVKLKGFTREEKGLFESENFKTFCRERHIRVRISSPEGHAVREDVVMAVTVVRNETGNGQTVTVGVDEVESTPHNFEAFVMSKVIELEEALTKWEDKNGRNNRKGIICN